ncbi:unnamed protein product [Schistosoma margrebowiei]|uniref:Uncharacterized protein n=1 Tax=Schistosoma margrebowiei TaxID=48269 RepID=A0A183N6K4_9TREM|nr:unnamed protein product [Schistosoma margrebowiei]
MHSILYTATKAGENRQCSSSRPHHTQKKGKILKYNSESSSPITLDEEALIDVGTFTYLDRLFDEQRESDADAIVIIGNVIKKFLQLKNL